jgi:hypothetical protein
MTSQEKLTELSKIMGCVMEVAEKDPELREQVNNIIEESPLDAYAKICVLVINKLDS